MNAADARKALEAAQACGEIVRVFRDGIEDGWVDGFVVGLGPDFFAMQVFDKACRVDGYNCFRYCDLTDLKTPAPHAWFLKQALIARARAQSPELTIDLTSLAALLLSAGKAFPLVAVFFLEDEEELCFIGQVQSVTSSEVQMLEISPNAEWDRTPTLRPLGGITCVEFGGAYAETLHLVSPSN